MNYNISVYTDGSARGNPGPGGFGVVMIWGTLRKEFMQGFKHTTNNRMELMGVIAALEKLQFDNCNVTVYTDSKYVADSVEKGWLFDWEKKRFKGKKNQDLWIRFLALYRKHTVRFVWVKGHAENKENNRCDKLAVKASFGINLPDDIGFDKNTEVEL